MNSSAFEANMTMSDIANKKVPILLGCIVLMIVCHGIMEYYPSSHITMYKSMHAEGPAEAHAEDNHDVPG